MTSNNVKLRKIDYGSARRKALGKMITDIYNEIPEIETRARSDLANRSCKYPTKLMVFSPRSLGYNFTASFSFSANNSHFEHS